MKIHMPRRINKIQHERHAVMVMKNRNRRRFNRDSPFTFQVHVIEHLVLKFALRDRPGPHEQPIGQRALTMVDMRDDREVTNLHAASARTSQ